jgi:hypothetical protein
MPWLPRRNVPPAALDVLVGAGLLAPADVPRAVRPARPRALDGWNFA